VSTQDQDSGPVARCADRCRMLCKGSAPRTGLVDMDVPWTFYRTGQSMHFRVFTRTSATRTRGGPTTALLRNF
jgi:hypothetical protein